MAKDVTIGIAKIEIAPLAIDGGEGTVFTTWGNTLEGTFSITNEDGTTTDINIEESEDAILSRTTRGAKTISWTIPDFDLADLPKILGGKFETNKWSAPTDNKALEYTVKVTPEQGYIMTFNRVSFNNNLGDGTYGRDNVLGIAVSGRVLKPLKEGVATYELSKTE